MLMPGRQFDGSSLKYRYGFNGKENDNEVKGEGNQQDYGMRIYDPRLGRFLSVDPLTKSFAWYSPYHFAGNMPIAAIDLDGEEQKIMIKWFDVNGNVTKAKIVKANFEQVNELYQNLSRGLNSEITYNLEGTKFNATNAQFVSGFEAYKEGKANPRAHNNKVRPSNGLLTFDISKDASGNESVKIAFDNAPINERELYADVLRGMSTVTNAAGTGIEAGGYVTSLIPGGQALGIPLIGIGKGTSVVGDFMDMGADLMYDKYKDLWIKLGVSVGGTLIGDGVKKLPLQRLAKESADTYFGKGIGYIKDGYFENRQLEVEESSKLDLKIEQKNKR
jgi:RHS repeat-associated protein